MKTLNCHIDDLADIIRGLAVNGETELEVSVKIKRREQDNVLRLSRPFQLEGRVVGLRAIANTIGVAVNTARRMIVDNELRTYRIGSRYCAYEDELAEDIEKKNSIK